MKHTILRLPAKQAVFGCPRVSLLLRLERGRGFSLLLLCLLLLLLCRQLSRRGPSIPIRNQAPKLMRGAQRFQLLFALEDGACEIVDLCV